MESNAAVSMKLENVLRVEREQAAVDRQNLLSQITDLVMKQGSAQDQRFEAKVSEVRQTIASSNQAFETSRTQYSQGMDVWNEKETKLVEDVLRSRETLKTKLKDDWVVSSVDTANAAMLTSVKAANKHNASLQNTTKSVHNETVRIVDEQMKDIALQMQALDDFVTRARSQNTQHLDSHTASLQGLNSTVQTSYASIGLHFASTYERVKEFGDDMSEKHTSSQNHLDAVDEMLRQPLAELRGNIVNTTLEEYQPTGQTPQKVSYLYPANLPQTGDHVTLLASLRGGLTNGSGITSPSKSSTIVFNDAQHKSGEASVTLSTTPSTETRRTTAGGLREINANIGAGNPILSESVTSASASSADPSITDLSLSSLPQIPTFKRSVTASGKLPMPKSGKKSLLTVEGRENVPPSAFSQSTGRRRSPRTG